jgi:starvation-inducible DNA-binding protein
MNKLIDSLLKAFANNFAFYLKAHQFHWAVLGDDFPQYHKFLEDIYLDAQEAIDLYAEELRRIGAFPKGDLVDIIKDTEISDAQEMAMVTDPQQMFLILLADLAVIVTRLQDTYDLAQTTREYGLQNFLAERISSHRKTQWTLTATVSPCAEYSAEAEGFAAHTMIDPNTGLEAQIETPAQHMAAEEAGYTEESAPYYGMGQSS